MRELDIGSKRFTKVVVLDEPAISSRACHEYSVRKVEGVAEEYAKVYFQDGSIKENSVNGCHQEDLLAIVIDRLRGFQSGEFRCRENAIALTKIEEALHWLNHRTSDRIERGVEGTSKV